MPEERSAAMAEGEPEKVVTDKKARWAGDAAPPEPAAAAGDAPALKLDIWTYGTVKANEQWLYQTTGGLNLRDRLLAFHGDTFVAGFAVRLESALPPNDCRGA